MNYVLMHCRCIKLSVFQILYFVLIYLIHILSHLTYRINKQLPVKVNVLNKQKIRSITIPKQQANNDD